jgi:two-component system NarL family sensor kinase
MIVSDQGRGFNYDEHIVIPSLGLKGMKERVKKLSGSFKLTSTVGNGTMIDIIIPLQKGV